MYNSINLCITLNVVQFSTFVYLLYISAHNNDLHRCFFDGFYKYETFCYAKTDPINVLQLIYKSVNGYTDVCIYNISGKDLYLYC